MPSIRYTRTSQKRYWSRVAALIMLKPFPADIQTGYDRSKYAGNAQMLRRPIGNVGRQDREHDLDLRVGDPSGRKRNISQPTAIPHSNSPAMMMANSPAALRVKMPRRSRPLLRIDRGSAQSHHWRGLPLAG